MNTFCCSTDANVVRDQLLEVCWAMDYSHDQTNEQLHKYHFHKLTEHQYVEHFEYLDRQSVQ